MPRSPTGSTVTDDTHGLVALAAGDVVWVSFNPVRGREQGGHRPAVIVAAERYVTAFETLALVVPVTSRDRGWVNHIELTGDPGLAVTSWAMAEQPTRLARERITGLAGRVDADCLSRIRTLIGYYLDL
jgi:mRNA interferase MazF